MNGIELYRQLEIERPEAVNKFIFTTGDMLSGNIKSFLEETGRPYLPKPFAPENLRAIVKTFLLWFDIPSPGKDLKMTNHEQKILIVDDEPMIRRLLHVKLSRQGYHCEEAGNAIEALDKMTTYTADLIMLDMKMPGMSGMDLLAELKATYPNTAVIMATAVAEANLAIQCMSLGADDYITKPFNLDEVVLNVEKTLEKRMLERQIKEYQEQLQQKVEEQTGEIRRLFLGSIEALVFALEAKDKYTAGHSRRVTEIALAIGHELRSIRRRSRKPAVG